jgi:hypothetical protein
MADIYAIQNGNWSSTSTWDDGIIPSFGDNVYANNKSIIIDIDANVESITDFAGLSAAGGFFTIANGISLTANIIGGGANNNFMCRVSSSPLVSCNIYGDISADNTNISVTVAFSNGSGTVNLYGNILPLRNSVGQNYSFQGMVTNGSGTFNVIGDIYGGLSFQSPGLVQTGGTGTINITGNVYGAPGGVRFSPAVSNRSTGAVNLLGNSYGGVGGGGIYNNPSSGNSGIVSITGNVYGGTGGGATNNSGVFNSGNGKIFIYGNSYGSLSGGWSGSSNTGSGSIYIYGISIGGRDSGSHGASNTGSAGLIYVKKAVGNGFGVLSQNSLTALAYGVAVGLNNTRSDAVCFVEEIECGPRGVFPLGGFVYLSAGIDTKAQFQNGAGQTLTLFEENIGTIYTPATSDVRLGVIYDNSNKKGTLTIPLSSQVNLGVPVDNTVGGAIFDSNNAFAVKPSDIRVPNTIGERISRVATTSATISLINNIS